MNKYKVTAGIFAGHEFLGEISSDGKTVYDRSTVGRGYPIGNCKNITNVIFYKGFIIEPAYVGFMFYREEEGIDCSCEEGKWKTNVCYMSSVQKAKDEIDEWGRINYSDLETYLLDRKL